MKNLIARVGMSILVTLVESAGRIVLPTRNFCLKHSHGDYGTRHWAHVNAYSSAPGWLFIELGSWTVEASWSTRAGMSRLKYTA